MTTNNSTTLRSHRPRLSTDTVHVLVGDLYGLKVLTCRELDSYDDRNFHVRVDEDLTSVHNEHLQEGLWPHGYVLKVLNSLDSQKPEVVEAKHTMTMAAAQKGFPSPRPVPSVSGQLSVLHPLAREHTTGQQDTGEEEKDGEKGEGEATTPCTEVFLIRLLEYLPGTLLASVPLTSHLSFQVGLYAARLDRMLQDVDDSKFPELRVDWNMDNVPSLRHLTRYLDDAEMARVVTEVIDAFETQVLKCESGLRTGLIHSDFNDHNILVEPETTTITTGNTTSEESPPSPAPTTAMRVCGILDFGDATKSFVLIEIAIAMAYMILMCPDDPHLDPDGMAGHALAGYLSEFPLSQQELDLLPLTICARFSQTVTFGFYRRILDPGNDYCLVHARKVWSHLRRLWLRPVHETLALWRAVARGHGVSL
ncbi:hypothetical protein ACOMHN_063742 [Nucella lapillus]